MNYEYLESVRDDIIDWVRDNIDYIERDITKEELYDRLIFEDCITGSASGSYWCNAWRAEECLCHNWDLLDDALCILGFEDTNIVRKGAEWCDCIIREYLLGQAIDETWDEIQDRLLEHEEQEAVNE